MRKIILANLKFNKDSEYILGPGDKLYLRFFGEKDFSGELDIINDGTISIPIVGDVYVAGLTKKMAEEKIEDLLTPHLIQKDVQVLILNPRKIKVIIIGEVNSPGIYSITEIEISVTNSDEKTIFFVSKTKKDYPPWLMRYKSQED